MNPYRTPGERPVTPRGPLPSTLLLLVAFTGSGACHMLYPEDQAALTQEVRLSTLAASHQTPGGIGQLLDMSNACAARAIQVRHKLAPTPTDPLDAGCPQ